MRADLPKFIVALFIVILAMTIASSYAESPQPAGDISFTLSAWVKMIDATDFWIISKGTRDFPEYAFGVNANDVLSMTIYDNSHSSTSTVSIYNATSTYIQRLSNSVLTNDENIWIHLAAVYDGSATSTGLTLYKNGIVAPSTVNASSTFTKMHNFGRQAVLGRLFLDGSSYAEGFIDDVRIYPYARSVEELLQDYNAGLGTQFR